MAIYHPNPSRGGGKQPPYDESDNHALLIWKTNSLPKSGCITAGDLRVWTLVHFLYVLAYFFSYLLFSTLVFRILSVLDGLEKGGSKRRGKRRLSSGERIESGWIQGFYVYKLLALLFLLHLFFWHELAQGAEPVDIFLE